MTEYSETARRIHADLPVIDGHNDLAWRLRTNAGGDLDAADPRRSLPGYHTDIPRMLAGGLGGQFWSVYVPCGTPNPFATTMEQIGLVTRMVERDDRLELARTAGDVRRIRQTGRIASLLGAEGGHAIEDSIGNLQRLAERGLRYMTLTHSDNTAWADSATDTPVHGGLTDFGKDVVREMNRLGVLVDISHVAVATMRDAIDTSEAPVIASHSNAAAIAPHPRNIPDDVLAAVGSSGGLVMAVFFPGFVKAETARVMLDLFGTWREIRDRLSGDEAAIAAEMDRIEAGFEIDRGSVGDVVNHIEHIAEVAGVDGVGIGSDFDGMTITPAGLEDVSCYPAITEELLVRGWTEPDIRKVLGENTLRIIEAADAVSSAV